MKRFYIKDNQVSFSLDLHEFTNEEDCNSSAELTNNGYDSYIDKDTDHSRWELVDGNLSEISMEKAMAETATE